MSAKGISLYTRRGGSSFQILLTRDNLDHIYRFPWHLMRDDTVLFPSPSDCAIFCVGLKNLGKSG